MNKALIAVAIGVAVVAIAGVSVYSISQTSDNEKKEISVTVQDELPFEGGTSQQPPEPREPKVVNATVTERLGLTSPNP